jgi:glycosyltransferase involved in cell wall biosynthesis
MTPPAGIATIKLGVDGRVLDDRYHGIGRITYELLDRLTGVPGIELTLFLRNQPESDRFDIDTLTGRPGVRVVRFDDPLTSVTQFLRWPGVLRRAGVDAVLFPYHLGASLLGAKRRYSIVHDCILEADKRFAPDARTRLLYIALTTVVVRRTTVLTPSRASAAAVRDFYKVRVPDSHVVEWGVGTSFASPAVGAERVADVNGVPLPDHYYLHVGARRPHKNVAQLVRALAGLPPQAHLVLVGSADARWPDPTMDLARELGVAERVIALSGVSEADLAALYHQARGFLYPSLVEGFGLPLLEAMSAGVPVVASDIPVFREVAEGAALFVPTDDTRAWIEAISALQDPTRRAALIEAGREHAAAANWQRATDRLVAILRAG